MILRVLAILAVVAVAAPAHGQFLSVPPRPIPVPVTPRPAPPRQPAPAPAPTPPTPAPSPLPTSFGANGFHCPVSGTVMRYQLADKAMRRNYLGTDPENRELCIVNTQDGGYLFGIVAKSANQAADYAAAYRKVLSGPPGTATDFLDRGAAFGSDSAWHMHFENDGLETLKIGGEPRPTIRILVTEKGVARNYFEGAWHRWFDVQTGAIIQQSFQLIHGQALTNQDWTATSITTPK